MVGVNRAELTERMEDQIRWCKNHQDQQVHVFEAFYQRFKNLNLTAH